MRMGKRRAARAPARRQAGKWAHSQAVRTVPAGLLGKRNQGGGRDSRAARLVRQQAAPKVCSLVRYETMSAKRHSGRKVIPSPSAGRTTTRINCPTQPMRSGASPASQARSANQRHSHICLAKQGASTTNLNHGGPIMRAASRPIRSNPPKPL